MILKISGNRIQKAFSRSSHQYEDLAQLQARVGEELLQQVKPLASCRRAGRQTSFRVLDVGTGTARMLPGLQAIFPQAQVIGLDLAFDMLKVARDKQKQIPLIQADAGRLPFKKNCFDLIVSNASYQWVADLHQAFSFAWSALKPGGSLYLTMFGYGSLKELFATLEKVKGDSGRELPRFNRLRRWEDVQRAAAEAGFQKIKGYHETRKIVFKDLHKLLRWLKGIGANTLGERTFIGREALKRADAFYRRHFGLVNGVAASFEIIWLKTVK